MSVRLRANRKIARPTKLLTNEQCEEEATVQDQRGRLARFARAPRTSRTDGAPHVLAAYFTDLP